jgi:hypothetical protein
MPPWNSGGGGVGGGGGSSSSSSRCERLYGRRVSVLQEWHPHLGINSTHFEYTCCISTAYTVKYAGHIF